MSDIEVYEEAEIVLDPIERAKQEITGWHKRAIKDALRKGHTPQTAAAMQGIDPELLDLAIAHGKVNRSPFGEFSRQCVKAKAEYDSRVEQVIIAKIEAGEFDAKTWPLVFRWMEVREMSTWAQKPQQKITATVNNINVGDALKELASKYVGD